MKNAIIRGAGDTLAGLGSVTCGCVCADRQVWLRHGLSLGGGAAGGTSGGEEEVQPDRAGQQTHLSHYAPQDVSEDILDSTQLASPSSSHC